MRNVSIYILWRIDFKVWKVGIQKPYKIKVYSLKSELHNNIIPSSSHTFVSKTYNSMRSKYFYISFLIQMETFLHIIIIPTSTFHQIIQNQTRFNPRNHFFPHNQIKSRPEDRINPINPSSISTSHQRNNKKRSRRKPPLIPRFSRSRLWNRIDASVNWTIHKALPMAGG